MEKIENNYEWMQIKNSLFLLNIQNSSCKRIECIINNIFGKWER